MGSEKDLKSTAMGSPYLVQSVLFLFCITLTCDRYYARFRNVVIEMLEKNSVNLFKFDGIGAGLEAYGAHEYPHKLLSRTGKCTPK